jgi:serine/threonine protein kinase
MTADQPGFVKQPNGGCAQPETRLDDSGPLGERSGSTERLPFPRQNEVPQGFVDPQPFEPVTGSVLGQIDAMMASPQESPFSIGDGEKRRVKLPRQFGRYRVLKRLGEGAMGVVYLVHDTELDRRVALKVPHFRSDYDPAPEQHRDLDRFYREARAAATLNHANLCPVYDVGELDGIPYLVMAYIKGRPLSRYIDRNRLMTQRRVATVVRKLALALHEAHLKGVVHRDLKPSNIMVNSPREMIIMDFGLVWRIGGQNERITRVGVVLGTPAYMSPEQVAGKAEAIGPGCDIYSLGVIMYELLTGSVPFAGPDAYVLGQICFVEPPPPSLHRPDVDPRLEAICVKAIAKSRAKRYATMAELAAALGDYLRSRSDRSRPPSHAGPAGADSMNGDTRAADLGDKNVPRPVRRPGEARERQSTIEELTISVTEAMSLSLAWQKWTVVIEHFFMRRPRHHVNPNDYAKLYKFLVETCRAHAEAAEGPNRAYYVTLEDLVLPWLTLTALERSDREILFSLLCRSREVERALLDRCVASPEPKKRIESGVRWRLAAVWISVLVVVCGLLFWGWFR